MPTPVIPRKRMEELYARTSKENPQPEDVEAFREALTQMPELVELAGNLAGQCQKWMMGSIQTTASASVLFEAGIDQLRQKLGYESAPDLEKLLIEQVVLCHLRLYLWEFVYNQAAGQTRDSERLQQWEKLIGMAQKRYLRAIEMLHRVRRLGIQIQVNVATDGGQQVNVGNIDKTYLSK